MILYQVVPRHLILQMILLLIFPKSEPGQLQKNRDWKVQRDQSRARRIPRRPDIYAYAQDLGIDSSLIRPIDTVASSRKNKSRQGITIRKKRQPVSIGQSSNFRVNRTDSAHSINARSASNIIPLLSRQ